MYISMTVEKVPLLILNYCTHITCISCNMHGNVLKPCMLHETSVLHVCRYKWNLHVTCAMVELCIHVHACYMHKISYRVYVHIPCVYCMALYAVDYQVDAS